MIVLKKHVRLSGKTFNCFRKNTYMFSTKEKTFKERVFLRMERKRVRSLTTPYIYDL